MKPQTILIDMDNTLADFDLEFGKRWAAARPNNSLEVITNRKHFELEQNFSDELQSLAIEIMSQPGLFKAFEPMKGAVEAVKEMKDEGHNLFFCTAPLPFQYETCVAEKYGWVRQHFGEEFLSKIIVTRDKTLVRGTVLIDDKPKVTGSHPTPEWDHIIFDRSYNKDVTGVPRLPQWMDWREVVTPILYRKC